MRLIENTGSDHVIDELCQTLTHRAPWDRASATLLGWFIGVTSPARGKYASSFERGGNALWLQGFPLLVQLEYHVGSKEAADTAEWLHSKFNDDPVVPGIRIPTCFTPNDGSLQPPQPRIAAEAERVMVVLLADDHLAANARTPTESGQTWADYVVSLRKLCEMSPNIYKFNPVQLTEGGWPIDTRPVDLNVLQAWAIESSERRQFIARRLTNLLIRQLRQDPSNQAPPLGNQESPPVTIFLSHTKLDIENEPHVVKSLLAYLTAAQPEKTWFDSGDIAPGSPFKDAIDRGVKDTALLAVLTDSYSSRSWCRREVLLAKHYQRPVVVVDAVQEREVRSFPYAGIRRSSDGTGDHRMLSISSFLRHSGTPTLKRV